MSSEEESNRTTERPAVREFVEKNFSDPVRTTLLDAGSFLARELEPRDARFGLSIAGPFGSGDVGPSTLCPLLEAGIVDWMVARGEDLYLDADRAFRGSLRDPKIRATHEEVVAQNRVRIGDVVLPGRELESTDLFLERLILTPPFQKIVSSAELNALLGRYLAGRDELLGVTDGSLLAVAQRIGVPLHADSPGASTIGRVVSAAALTGNRLIVDMAHDLNQTAGYIYEAKRAGSSVVCCIGGGMPRDLIFQASRHLESPLRIGSLQHDAILEIAPRGRLRIAGRLDPKAPRPRIQEAELPSSIALPVLTAYLLEKLPVHLPHALFKSRTPLVEQLREAHVLADLERQQLEFQEKVRTTGQQFQARVQEQQSKFQAEVTKVQRQVHKQIQRLLQQAEGDPDDDRS